MANYQTYEIKHRLMVIEIIAYWEGRVTISFLCELYGIERQQASADIDKYLEFNPNSLKHTSINAAYIASIPFKPVLSPCRFDEYMTLVNNQKVELSTMSSQCEINTLTLADRAIKPTIVRAMTSAIKERVALNVQYASLENPKPHHRILSPNRIIYSGFRWHLRAFCHIRLEYRDFLLSRITKAKKNNHIEFRSNKKDQSWHEKTELIIIANPFLTREQQQVIQDDFCMKSGELKIKTNRALKNYLLSQYQIDPTIPEQLLKQYPRKYQLVLKNHY